MIELQERLPDSTSDRLKQLDERVVLARLMEMQKSLRRAKTLDEKRECRLDIEALRSELRHSRLVKRGIEDYAVVQALDFASRNPLTMSDRARGGQSAVRKCLRELMRYGHALHLIGQRLRPRDRHRRTPPLRIEVLMQTPEVARLNAKFRSPSFDTALEVVRHRKLVFTRFATGAPIFFSFGVEIAPGNEAATRIFEFLSIVGQIDPRLWARCESCRDYFLRKQARQTTTSCSDACRYTKINRLQSRKDKKAKASRQYLKGGLKYRG